LELLIDRLSDFSGTVLLVSHDRYFLDQLATKTWAFEGNGNVRAYAGGYEDWKAQGGIWPEAKTTTPTAQAAKLKDDTAAVVPAVALSKPKKRSYKDQREFDQMPALIERLESEIATLTAEVAAPGFYSSPSTVTGPKLEQLLELEGTLNITYERWAQLEDMVG